MGNSFISRIKSYKEWENKKILVIHMNTPFLDVESCLKLKKIPFSSIYYRDDNFSSISKLELDKSVGIIITGSRIKGETGQEEILSNILKSDLPKLGLCFGCEILAKNLGASIVRCNPPMGEFSESQCDLMESLLFRGIETPTSTIVTMAHKYMIGSLPAKCDVIAKSDMTPIAGFECLSEKTFGLQFHPEKGWMGDIVFENFYNFCTN